MELWRQEHGLAKLLITLSAGIILPFYLSVPLMLWTIYQIFKQAPQVWRSHLKDNRWWIIFIIYSLVVALVRQNYIGAVVSLCFLGFAYLFNYYRSWIRAEVYLKLLHFHVLASGFLAIYAIFVYVKYSLDHHYGIFYIFRYNNIQTRAEATFFNANYYGLYCLFVIAIILYLHRKVQVKRVQGIYMGVLVLNLIAIILTGSRWLWPSVIFVIGVFYLMLNLRWLKYILGGVVAVIVTIIVKPNILPRVDSLAYAFKDRWTLWSGGWGLFTWRPFFGTGAMTYMTYYYLFTDNGNMHSHNLFIDVLANYGIIGAVILVFAIFRWAFRYRYLLHNHACRLEMVFLVTCLLIIGFHGLMDVAILWVQTAYVALMILTIPPQALLELSEIDVITDQEFHQYVAILPKRNET